MQDGHNIYGSSGVGLSLVKDFVELHDGTITVGDRKGGGTVFDILLPIRHDAALRQLVPQENAPLLDADTNGAFVNMVSVDVAEYAKEHFEKSVRKTLTIPAWLNVAAQERKINFSQTLQEALLAKIRA